MDDNLFFYILIFPTILNTILLLVMAFVLYKLLIVAGDFANKFGKVLDRSEEELFSTTSAFRHLASQAGNLLERFVQMADRYMYAQAFRQSQEEKQKWSRVMSGLNVGYNVFNFIMRILKKEK